MTAKRPRHQQIASPPPSLSSEMSTASEDVSKLAVPALKALCKERGLAGYSKLSKQALIDKLSGYSQSTVTVPNLGPSSTSIRPDAGPTESSASSAGLGSPAILGFTATLAVNPSPVGVSSSVEVKKRKKPDVQPGTDVKKQKNAPGPSASVSESSLNTELRPSLAVSTINVPHFAEAGTVCPTTMDSAFPGTATSYSVTTEHVLTPQDLNITPTPGKLILVGPLDKSDASADDLLLLPRSSLVVKSSLQANDFAQPSKNLEKEHPNSTSSLPTASGSPNSAPPPSIIRKVVSKPAILKKPSFVVPHLVFRQTNNNVNLDVTSQIASLKRQTERPLLLPVSKSFRRHNPQPKEAPKTTSTNSTTRAARKSLPKPGAVWDIPSSHSIPSSDTPALPSPPPLPISLPPRLAHRTVTARLAVILAYVVDDEEARKNCCLVSRAWRYAGELFWGSILYSIYSQSLSFDTSISLSANYP